jgi:hypothetical protein
MRSVETWIRLTALSPYGSFRRLSAAANGTVIQAQLESHSKLDA